MEQATLTSLPEHTFEERWPDRIFSGLFYLFLFVSIFLPSGTLYQFNFKYPLYLGLLPFTAWHLFFRRRVTRYELASAACALSLLLFWYLIGVGYGFPATSITRQFTDVLLLLLLCTLISIFVGRSAKRRRGFLRVVLFAVVATAIMKGALIAYSILSGKPLIELLLLLNKIFDVDLMTMDINDLFGRVQFYSDFVIPTCIFMILRYRGELRIGTLVASCSLVLLFASSILSFSRFIWAFTIFALLLGLVLGKRDRFQTVLLSVLGVAIVASLPLLIQVYDLRFSAAVVASSDSARVEQAGPLRAFFAESPIFGHGFGSYNPALLRTQAEGLRFGYELQLLALLGQVGIAGMSMLLLAAAFYFRALWQPSSGMRLRDRFGLMSLLLFWLSAGLTNPLLFLTVAAVNYAALQNLSTFGRPGRGPALLPS